MKKFLVLILCVVCVLIFASCGVEQSVPGADSKPPEESMHTHDFSIVNSNEIEHWRNCTGCEEFRNSEKHIFKEKVIEEPTYTSDGSGERECIICGYSSEYEIPMLTHDCNFKVVNEDLTQCGESYWFECDICGDGYYSSDKKAHSFVDYECEICEFKYISEGVYFQRNDSEKYVKVLKKEK